MLIYRQKRYIQNTKMTNIFKSVNDFVISFLNEHDVNTDDWTNVSTQGPLKKLLNKSMRANTQKDPNFPKRGKSAYLFFCSAMRNTVKDSLPDTAKATDVTRELGSRWNTLKADNSRSKELAKYNEQATEDKQRYKSELEAYEPNEKVVMSKKMRVKNADAPKRAKSAYLFFCSDQREEVKKSLGDTSSATDITRELGKRWNKLKDANGTAKFEALATKDRERYYEEKSPGQSIPEKAKKPVPVEKVSKKKEPVKKEPVKKEPVKKEPVEKVSKKKEPVKKAAPKKAVAKKA